MTKMAAATVRHSNNDIVAKACALLQGRQATENGGRASMTLDTVRMPRTAMTVEGQMSPRGARNKGKDACATRATMPAQCRQRRWRNAGNDASVCHDCFVIGQMPVCDAGGKKRRQGQK